MHAQSTIDIARERHLDMLRAATRSGIDHEPAAGPLRRLPSWRRVRARSALRLA